jgi:RNA polymerase sigma-32 factor
MGLVEAARRFDPARGVVFGSYARWWIFSFVWRAEASEAGVNLSSKNQNAFFGMGRAITACEAAGVPPTDEQLAKMLNVSVVSVAWIRPIVMHRPVQIDHPGANKDETWANDRHIFPQLMDTNTPESHIAETHDAAAMRRRIGHALSRLSPKERDVIKRRYLGKDETLQAISADWGLSRERIRQVEMRALGRLRAIMKKAG